MSHIYSDQLIPGLLKDEVILETSNVLASYHTKPYWEHHVVIIPKVHIDSLPRYQCTTECNQDFFEAMKLGIKLTEDKYGICRISSNVGNYQSSNHLHWYTHHGKRLSKESESPEH